MDKSQDVDSFFKLDAAAKYVGEHCVIYVDTSESVPQVSLDSLRSAFDDTVYPKLTAALGQPPPASPDEPDRVTILLYDFGDPSLQGFFLPADIAPASGEAHSNQRQIFYINSETAESEPEALGALAAHEFSHLIAYYYSYMLDADPARTPPVPWLEEGIASYAEHLAGYDIRVSSQLLNFAYASNTDLTETPWPGFNENYGASYAFVSFLVGREGPAFLAKLIDQSLDGIAGINAALRSLGSWDTFDSLFADWVVADFLGAHSPVTLEWSIPGLTVASQATDAVGASPWIGSESVTNYGAQYLDFPASPSGSSFRVVLAGDDGAPLHADLICWDSQGQMYPSVVGLDLSGSAPGGSVQAPLGYDRHTLVVWAQGTEGDNATYGFRYSAAVDPPAGVQFLDLGGDDPYYPYVAELVSDHLVSGKEIPAGSGLWFFQGGSALLRAQLAKLLVLALGVPAEESMKSPFTDLGSDGPGDLYPKSFVAAAYAAGIVQGTTPTTFSPYTSVSRAQAITMVVRAAQKLLPGLLAEPPPSYQGSLGDFSTVHAENARIAQYNHLLDGLVGFGPGWDPWQPCSRDEAAALLAGLLDLEGSHSAPSTTGAGVAR